MDKNQFNNHYQLEEHGRPLYAQPTAEHDYEETSDGYGNQSIEDDIQNIIFQAQQAYANKQITSEEFDMIKGTQQQPSESNFNSQNTAMTNEVCSPPDNILMPQNSFLKKLGNNTHMAMKEQSFNNMHIMHGIDVNNALNHRKSNQNIMSSQDDIDDSKRYIDTNIDKDEEVYENHDNMQWTNQLSQIQEEETMPRNYQLRSLEQVDSNNYTDFEEHRIEQTVSVGALPVMKQMQYTNEKGHSTGHFNSRTNKIQLEQVSNSNKQQQNPFGNQFDGINSPHIGSEYYVMSSQPVTGRRSREGLDSNRPFSSQSRTISQMDRNGKYGDRLHSNNKSKNSIEIRDGQRQSVRSKSGDSRGRSRSNHRGSSGGGIENVISRNQSRDRRMQKSSERQNATRSITHTESLPQSIHSERSSEYKQKSEITQVRDQTIFAQQFKRLYEKIQEIYPGFQKVANQKDIPNLLQSDDMLSAQNIYSQLSFLHDKVLEGGPKTKVQNDKELVSLMKDQASSNNNMLKHQIENTQRETEYYKKQMEIFKDQMHKANIREQKVESELSFFKTQVGKYEDQIVKIQRENTDLERKTFELKMNKMNDETNNISFRGSHTQENVSYNQPYKSPDRSREIHSSSITKSRTITAGVSPHNRIPDLSLATGDSSRLVSQIQADNKELRSKLKMKEELVGFEKQANEQLNLKIDKMAEEFRSELSYKKQEIEQLSLDNRERIETIRLMNQQLQNFTEFTSVEFPIMNGPGAALSKRDQSPLSGSINLNNQNKNAKLVSMRNTKKDVLAAIDDEMENIMQKQPFVNDSDGEYEADQKRKLLKNQFMPTGIRTKMNKSQMNLKNKKKNQQQNPIVSLFGLSEMLHSQINSISIVDEVMIELQQKRKDDSNLISKEIENMEVIQHNIESLNKEKEDFSNLQKVLTKENQDLKQKFSDLLDQFQEYVNESECKMDEERILNKENQDKILTELNNTIEELQKMSKQLESDNMQKIVQIDRIELEKSQLQKDIDFLKDQAKNQDEAAEQLLKQQIQSLNEEISYLKKHYMVEMDVLRQENTILQQKHTFEKSNLKNYPQDSLNDVQEELPRQNNVWQTPGQQNPNKGREVSANLRLSRQKSQVIQSGDNEYNMPFGRSTFNNESFDRRGNNQQEEYHPDDLDSQQRDSRNIRSSSYDNFIAKSRSSRLSRSRDRNERDRNRNRKDGSQNKSNQRPTSRAKDLISGAQCTFDGLKRELTDKDRLIESKNREIVKLRLENDEIKSNFEVVGSLQVNQNQRQRTCNDLAKVTETLKQELERTKINLFKGDSNSALSNHHQNFDKMRPDEVMNCEAKMLQIVNENVHELKNLISLSSEIFLLSSKFKYGLGSNSNHSPNKLTGNTSNVSEFQRLVKENENLQRTVYKYEGAIAHMKSSSDINPSNDSIQDLKRLTQSQLAEIMNLQSQLENMERQLMEKENGNSQSAMQENRVLKTEINLLRENEARNEQLREGNEELLQERRGLISRIEQMEKEYQESTTNFAEKEQQHEELRSRITVIAELFEKKPISQRYSFEVLCDFIHDKAKRLFNKYENAIKDKKLGADERGYSNQRKIQMLEQDLSVQSELVNCCKGFAVPKLYSILNNGNQISQNELERQHLSSYVRSLVCDIETTFARLQQQDPQYQLKTPFNQISSNTSQNITMNPMLQQSQSNLGQQNNGYSNQVSMRNTPSNINTIHTMNNNEGISQHQLGISGQTSEFENIKEEKEVLNKKLDEFTKILGEFQKNQQTYEQENQQLKHKIGYLESRTENLSLSGTAVTQIGRNGLIPQSQGQPTQHIHFQKQSMGTSIGQLDNETTNVQSQCEQNNFIGYQPTNC